MAMKNKLISRAPVPVLVQHALNQMAERATIARKARGLTQADLAHLADVGVSTIASIEGGHDGVSIGNLLKVLSALNLLKQAEGLFNLSADSELIEFGRQQLKPAPLPNARHAHRGSKDE